MYVFQSIYFLDKMYEQTIDVFIQTLQNISYNIIKVVILTGYMHRSLFTEQINPFTATGDNNRLL